MDISYKILANNQNHRFNYRVAAIIEANGLILISKVIKDDFFFLPGGRVQIGETTEDALIREMTEELDVKATLSGLAFIVENFFHYEEEAFHELGFFFKVDGSKLNLPQHEEIREDIQFFWHDANNIEYLNLKPKFLISELKNMSDIPKHIVNLGHI